MKKLIPYLLVYFCSACGNLYHEEEISIGEIESVEELESAVDGVYAKLASTFTDDAFRNNIYYSVNLKGDDLGETDPIYSATNDNSENCSSDNKPFQHSWGILYGVITSANNIIIQFDPEKEQHKDIARQLGEVYLLRAYCYFRLTRTYGRIPVIRDIEIDYQSELSSFQEIYEFVESDLKMAMVLLPENNSNARIPFVTPHRGTAKALLAEVYLSWAGYPVNDDSKYAKAANEAGDVIDSADFFGFALEEDFAHIWDKTYAYNPETVFALYFTDPLLTDNYSEINAFYRGRCRTDFGTFKVHPDSLWLILWYFGTEINFYNAYPESYRKDITFFSTVYAPNGYVHVSNAGDCNRPAYRKFFYSASIKRQESGSYIFYDYLGNPKIYLFRYAHTLLTYAEAIARSGQPNASAYKAVNRIRRRANSIDQYVTSIFDLTPGLSAEAFADSVVNERAWELAGEPEGRWFDLVRLERVEELLQLRNPQEGGWPEAEVSEDDYFSPIPENEYFLNPNLNND